MRKKLVIIIVSTLFMTLFSCNDDKENDTYGDFKISFQGDLETTFKKEGETRSFSLIFTKQRYSGGVATGEWVEAIATAPQITIDADPDEVFSILNQQLEGNTFSFDISVPENETENLNGAFLGIIEIDEEGEEYTVIYKSMRQEKSEINREYRIVSEKNPFQIPLEGGGFTVGITVESRKTINGRALDWEFSTLKGLRGVYSCMGASSHHELELKKGENPGHYYFNVAALPYYLNPGGMEYEWFFRFRYNDIDMLNQEFLHDQDDTLKDKGFPPAHGNVGWSSSIKVDEE